MTLNPKLGHIRTKQAQKRPYFSSQGLPLTQNLRRYWPLHILLKIISLDFEHRFLEPGGPGILKGTVYWVKLNIFVCPELRQNRLKCSPLKIQPFVFFRTFDHDVFLFFLFEVRHSGLLKSLSYLSFNIESF